jgi:hypothetical protein
MDSLSGGSGKKEQTIRDRQPGPGSVTREFRVRLSNSNGVRVFALFYKPFYGEDLIPTVLDAVGRGGDSLARVPEGNGLLKYKLNQFLGP